MTNPVLSHFPLSINLDIIYNSRKRLFPRGSTVLALGSPAGRHAHLIFSGTVNILERVSSLSSENLDLTQNKDMSAIYIPKHDVVWKLACRKVDGDFLESELLGLGGPRRYSAVVESENALIMEVDLNVLLCLDRVYGLVNSYTESMSYWENKRRQRDTRLHSEGLAQAVQSSDQMFISKTVEDACGDRPIPKLTTPQIDKIILYGWGNWKTKKVKHGFNTIISSSVIPHTYTKKIGGLSAEKKSKPNQSTVQPSVGGLEALRANYLKGSRAASEKIRLGETLTEDATTPICRYSPDPSSGKGRLNYQEYDQKAKRCQSCRCTVTTRADR